MARRPGGEAAIRSRLAVSPGLSDAEAHTLAGFLDAESHGAPARKRAQRRSSTNGRWITAWSKRRGRIWHTRRRTALHPRRCASIAARQPPARPIVRYSGGGRVPSMGGSRVAHSRPRELSIPTGQPATRSRRPSVPGTTRSGPPASPLVRLGLVHPVHRASSSRCSATTRHIGRRSFGACVACWPAADRGASRPLSSPAARPVRSTPRPPGPAIPGSLSSPPRRAPGSGRRRFRALRRGCAARCA
jgi:hypothetical protein